MDQEITLNIPYNLHEEDWKDLYDVYASMPGWKGFDTKENAYWFGNVDDEIHLEACVEPDGLVISGVLPDEQWEKWITEFIEKATFALGYEVKAC
jgi:hypothetical protein